MFSDDGATQWNDSDVLKWREEAERVPALLAKLDELRTTLDEVRGTVDVETRLLRKQVEQLRDERNEQWGKRKDTERRMFELKAEVADLEKRVAYWQDPGKNARD